MVSEPQRRITLALIFCDKENDMYTLTLGRDLQHKILLDKAGTPNRIEWDQSTRNTLHVDNTQGVLHVIEVDIDKRKSSVLFVAKITGYENVYDYLLENFNGQPDKLLSSVLNTLDSFNLLEGKRLYTIDTPENILNLHSKLTSNCEN